MSIKKTDMPVLQAWSLSDAFLHLETREECARFLADLCTPQEIQALNERWIVCQYLYQGNLSYRDIHALTGVSLTTITRVGRFLNLEPNKGYRSLLDRLTHQRDTSP